MSWEKLIRWFASFVIIGVLIHVYSVSIQRSACNNFICKQVPGIWQPAGHTWSGITLIFCLGQTEVQ